MSNGGICGTGGIRIHSLDGQSEMIYFPEGYAREELLESIDPELRESAETLMESGGFYDMSMGEQSTPEGEVMSIIVKDFKGSEDRSILLWGGQDPGPGERIGPISSKRGISTRTKLCAKLLVGGSVLNIGGGLGLMLDPDSTRGWYELAVSIGGVAMINLGTWTVCRKPPRPPAPPSTPAGRHLVRNLYGEVEWHETGPFGRSRGLNPEPLWLIPTALVGALILVLSGGSLGLQPAGLSLTVKGQSKSEIY